MLLGWIPEMLVGGVTYGLGRAYNKPWARVVGGGLMIATTAWTILRVVTIVGARDRAQGIRDATAAATPPIRWDILT